MRRCRGSFIYVVGGSNLKRLNKHEATFWECWTAAQLVPGDDLEPRYSIMLEIDGQNLPREFDFGSSTARVLVEIDGLGGFDPVSRRERCGGHQTASGMARDSAKRNAAVIDGWRVLVYPSSRINSPARLRVAAEEVAMAICRAVHK